MGCIMTPRTRDKLLSLELPKFFPQYLEYAQRIRKTLYYGELPATDRPSLPFTSMSVEKFSEICRQDGLEKLDCRYASAVCYDACVTPCSLIVALMYLDRLRTHNPEYLANTSPSQVFLVATMVASKYLYDDGEEDEVFNDEWATSASLPLTELNQAERDFLIAIDWNLFVDNDAFVNAFERVESEVSWREGVKRGHFTYTDLVSLTKTLPSSSCTSFIHLLNKVLAVCIVGYTAAMVSVVAGTVLAHECTKQIMQELTTTTTTAAATTTSTTTTTSLNATVSTTATAAATLGLLDQPQDIAECLPAILDSLHSLADANESTAPGSDERGDTGPPNTHGPLPSRAITTLTTSILLAMSSPSRSLHHDDAGGTQHSHGRTEEECVEVEVERDPSDIHLAFTTGPYWPPSYGCRSGSRFADVLNFDVGFGDAVGTKQKDWVYSNPWVIPWLPWHGTPAYSLIQNFTGIGAPNLQVYGRNEITWMDRIAWLSDAVMGMMSELTHTTSALSLPMSTIQTVGPSVVQSVSEFVPWVM